MKTTLLALGTAAFMLAGTAACGGDEGGTGQASPSATATATSSATASHNEQDVMFAQMMIPHHRQAVQMSEIVADKSGNAEVKRLARQIEQAQAPEIETMTGWLKRWGATVPPEGGGAPSGGHGGHGDGGQDGAGQDGAGMPGMMTPEQMGELKKATGAGLDRMFLTMMIEHHEGAVAMAEDEQAKGADPEAKKLAGTIIKTQQDEIAKMRALLK
ncbi:DUF305 domain-containing protein [Actinomadura sp. 9N407]|uniref:DUF305 domain-containing protein n=1 Tax=Actinomadura sp. 9N407 TaxID=3375154 RepID=UPI00378D8527